MDICREWFDQSYGLIIDIIHFIKMRIRFKEIKPFPNNNKSITTWSNVITVIALF